VNIEEVKQLIYMYNKVIELAREIKEDTESLLDTKENEMPKHYIWQNVNKIEKIISETLGVDKE